MNESKIVLKSGYEIIIYLKENSEFLLVNLQI